MLYYIYILKATSIICCDIKLKIVNSFLGLNLVKIFQQFLFQNFFLKLPLNKNSTQPFILQQ